MAAKTCFIVCAIALFAQETVSQCLGRMAPCLGPLNTDIAFDGLAYDSWAYGPAWNTGRLGCGAYAPISDIAAASSLNAVYGGGLPIASASAAAPTGLAVASENAYEGIVAVAGNLPFLGTVAMEGVFPTAGAGAISYGCGDGIVAMTAEGPIAGPVAIAPAIAPLGLTSAMAPVAATSPFGYANCGCGCGGPYLY